MKKQSHQFANKGPYSQSCGFSCSHVQIWELDDKKSWSPKNWCFKIVVLKKTLESTMDSKEIKPINPKRNQSWIFIGRTDAEAEAPMLWPPDVKSWLTAKDPDAGKDWRQVEKGAKEDKIVGWHHRLKGHEFEQTPGDRRGQRSLACCSPRGCKELDVTEGLNDRSLRGWVLCVLEYSAWLSTLRGWVLCRGFVYPSTDKLVGYIHSGKYSYTHKTLIHIIFLDKIFHSTEIIS